MLRQFRPAVYKCIIPVDKPLSASSAIYRSPLGGSKKAAQSLPFSAWPEIEDPYQPLCLPTLHGAMYFHARPPYDESEVTEKRAEEYLLRLEILEPEISEQLITFLKSKSKQTLSHDVLRKHFGVERFTVFEIIMQSYIYGGLNNFYSEAEAFGWGHERAHNHAIMLYGKEVGLGSLSLLAHGNIHELITKSPSYEQTAEIWSQYRKRNDQIERFVQKFEPIEEIYATYIGLRLSPNKVRNAIKKSIKRKLIKRGWYTAYKAFAEVCDNCQFNTPFDAASYIYKGACRILKEIDVDGAHLLYRLSKILKAIWSYIKQEIDINPEDRGILERIKEYELLEFVKKNNCSLEEADIGYKAFWSCFSTDVSNPRPNSYGPIITLIGFDSLNCIDFGGFYVDPWGIRIFYESLRQQINRRCGIFCPFAVKGRKLCCGFRKDLRILYKRLPEKDKIHFQEPDCDRVR